MWLSARWGGAFTPLLVAAVMGVALARRLAAARLEAFLRDLRLPRRGLGRRCSTGGSATIPFDKPKMNDAERELIARDGVSAADHVHVPWGRLLASKQVWMLCWQYFCLSYGWYFYVTWLPKYLKEARHLNFSQHGDAQRLAPVRGRDGQPRLGDHGKLDS